LVTYCVVTAYYNRSFKEKERKDGSEEKMRKKMWAATG